MSFEQLMKLRNKEAVLTSLNGVERDVQAAVAKNLKAGGEEVRETLRASLPEAPSPEVHSTPGGVPYSQTGELKKHIRARVEPFMLGEPITLKIYVTAKGFWGRMLEFGTSKMAARPWFYSGIVKKFPFLSGNVAEALAAVVERRNKRK